MVQRRFGSEPDKKRERPIILVNYIKNSREDGSFLVWGVIIVFDVC
jgi:hypothetical protein